MRFLHAPFLAGMMAVGSVAFEQKVGDAPKVEKSTEKGAAQQKTDGIAADG